MIGTRLDRAAVDRAGDEVAAAVRPTGDLHGSGPYRRAMAALLTRRALDEARGATVAR